MAPRPLKAIQIWLKESTVLIWWYCTLSAMPEICNFVREATQFELLDHISLYSFFFWLPFLARWSKVSVWTVRQKSTFRFRLASLASKMHHAKVSWSLIHTSAPMGAFFIPALIFFFFCSNTCSGREGALNLSAFLFISQCTAVIRLKAKTSPNAAMPPPWAQGLESVKA